MSPNRRIRIVAAVAAAVFAATVSMLAGEGILRYREGRRAVPGAMPLIYYAHQRLHHALVRDMDYFGLAHINRFGFRGAEVELAKPAGAQRIMVIGGSTTFDTQATRDDRTWPARLEHWLEKLGSGPVQVINAGVPGYTTLDNLIRLQTELYRFEPDVLVLYEGHNDVFHALNPDEEGPSDPRTPDEIVPMTPWVYWLKRHSLFYAAVSNRLQVMRFFAAKERASQRSKAEDTIWSSRLDVGAERFERDFLSLALLAQRCSRHVVIPELIAVSGVNELSESSPEVREMWERTLRAPAEVVLRAYARANATIAGVAKRSGATLVATGEFGLTGLEWYAEGDPIHFNDRGSDRMASKMAEALIASGLVAAKR